MVAPCITIGTSELTKIPDISNIDAHKYIGEGDDSGLDSMPHHQQGNLHRSEVCIRDEGHSKKACGEVHKPAKLDPCKV